MPRFLKLDTRVISGFDAALAPDVMALRSGLGASLRTLWRRRGAGAVLRALAAGLVPGERIRRLCAGNVARKRIRLPLVARAPLLLTPYARAKMLSTAVFDAALAAVLEDVPPEIAIVYNGSLAPESVLADRAGAAGLPRVFVEAGFFPGTLQIDPRGLNGANSVPRDPAFYLAGPDFAARGLPPEIGRRPSKRRGVEPVTLAPGYVFVPFQVPSDMQVTVQSPWVRSMEAFVELVHAMAEALPGERFVIKEHPSFKRSVRGHLPPHERVIFANGNDTAALIEGARAVVTLNSTVGLESLLIGRPVITLGRACYNVEGLVLHADGPDALAAALEQSRNWRPDETLRRQFLGYLWSHYLVHGSYDALPADLAEAIARRADPDFATAV